MARIRSPYPNVFWNFYNFQRSQVTNILRFSNFFFSTQVCSLKGQSNKLWNTLKTVFPSKRSDTKYPSDITPLDFNKFYTTDGVNLTRDLPFVQKHRTTF